jgi:hypothetical protein
MAKSEADTETEISDTPLIGWRVATSDRSRALIREVRDQVERIEQREKVRSAEAQGNFEAALEALLSELVPLHLEGERKGLAVPRRAEDLSTTVPAAYRSPAHRPLLADLLDTLEALSYIEQAKGYRVLNKRVKLPNGRNALQTTIWAGRTLKPAIKRHGVGFADFGYDPAEPVILLRGFKPGRGEGDTPINKEPRAPLIDYNPRLPKVKALAAEIGDLNKWYANADISGDLPGIDTTARRLRRHFNRESFESGGRLFGAFWLNMPKRLRPALRLDGEPTCNLDYRSMFLALAYARAGVRMPGGDAYQLLGFEECRKGVKQLAVASLFRDTPMTRLPKGSSAHFPKSMRRVGLARRLMAGLKLKHPGIASMFETMCGHSLMFDESRVLLAVLNECKARGITSLPLHDAVVCPVSARSNVKEVMFTCFERVTGGACEVVDDGEGEEVE